MVADGLSIINADFSSTSFRVSRASIGAHNFLGNNIAYPAQGRTGDNCLLATKVMVPIDGQVREGVGLLGSPSFEIPRSVERDSRFDLADRGRAAPPPGRQEPAQPRHHGRCSCWCGGSTSSCSPCSRLAAADLYHAFGAVAVALANVAHRSCSRVVYFVLVERAVRPASGPAAAVLLDLRPALLAARAVLEGACGDLPPGCSTAPRSRTWSGGCWVSGSARGSSTTAAT